MVLTLVAVAAAVALAGYLLPYGLAVDDAMMSGQPDAMSSDGAAATLPEYARYDADSIDSRVQAAVVGALRLYWAEGQAAFEMITPGEAIHTDTIYPFILDAETLETVAHGAFPDLAGVVADTLTRADSSIDRIHADLERDGATWAEYMATNPANGLIQPKRSWLYLHDGYIFGSGHYLSESKVKYVVEDAVRLYESKGQEAFGIITPEETLLVTELYPFIFNSTTLKTVAHGAIPDRLGHVPYSVLNTGDRPIEEIMADLERDGGTWVEYVFTNPATETKQLKRSWLYLHGGYIFGSGYYLQDSRAESLVAEAIILYKAGGQDAFDTITPDVADPLVLQSAFVLDEETLEVEAHGLVPDLVGSTDQHLDAADRSLERVMEELRSADDAWVWYMAQNPGTLTDQLTRTYLSLYDGYIFGAGYSLPDSRVQSMADEATYTYRNDPETGFDVISSGALNRLDTYPFVRNLTHIQAHGTLPHIIGPLPDVQTARSYEDTWNAAVYGGGTVWSQYSFINPYTGTDQIKRAWLSLYDEYLFSSTYNVPDADTQSVVDYATFIYESNKENDAWIDIITPEETVITDDLYPFVINATSWTRLADGVVPDRVGKAETILDSSVRSVEEVLVDLEANGATWVTYPFHNPSTGTEQLKRTYLQLRDGLVFGSGYYILDSQVQAIAYNQVLEYDHDGRDAAFADINTVPEEPVSTYVFVVDPATGMIQAQNVNPDLIGDTSDWDAISSDLPIDDILEKADAEGGAWASYTFANPATGDTESKRTWLIMHDGLVFGSGYYSSDIPEADVLFVVDSAIFTYESNKENDAWIDIITPDEAVATDDLYPFVIDAASWTRLADGVVPDRVGKAETILDTSGRSVEDVLADLEADGSVWVTYTFHNPSTDTEQLKRTYLEMRDGLVFGSGYYLLDSQVQAATYGQILEYNNKGRDAAFADLNTIPEQPVSTYVFVADPATGMIQAQNVNPDLIGDTSDWDAIITDLPVDDILSEIGRGTGTWVTYTLTNPVTGDTADKRTWLVMHDGLVFGSGYYTSD